MNLNDWITEHYDYISDHLQKYCKNRGLEWSEDTFHLTLLKTLEKERLHDMTDQGILNYIFKAFRTNTLRERQYPWNARRSIIEELPDKSDTSPEEREQRIASEVLSDWMAARVLALVAQNFEPDTFNAFRLKSMSDMTYKQLEAKTGLTRTRKKMKEVRDWLRDNVSMEMLRNEYDELNKIC